MSETYDDALAGPESTRRKPDDSARKNRVTELEDEPE